MFIYLKKCYILFKINVLTHYPAMTENERVGFISANKNAPKIKQLPKEIAIAINS